MAVVSKLKTLNRLLLKTPKIEGEPVLMGKREADGGYASLRERSQNKKTQATTESTAEAANQPRRSS